MIKGLLLGLVVLFVMLGVLNYVDRRVASMPRLDDDTVGGSGILSDSSVDKRNA